MTVVVEAGEGEAGLAGEAGHEDAPCAGDIGESGDAWRGPGPGPGAVVRLGRRGEAVAHVSFSVASQVFTTFN